MNRAVAAAGPRIDAVSARRLRLPLTKPYDLAFGAIDAFDTILVELDAEGRCGMGECTVLNGYTDETIEGAWTLARELAASLRGRTALEARASLDAHLPASPFAVTAFGTALDMAQATPLLRLAAPFRVPLLAILGAKDEAGIETEIEAALANGYKTLKIKVGFEIESDLARVRLVQRLARGRLALRIDANQGYSRGDGCRFASEVPPENVELFEQACDKDDWDACVAVARAANVPIMLDEAIYGTAEIERAADLRAAKFVKLKLMKLGTLDRLVQACLLVKRLGMEPVLGNGVATELGCWMEACVALRLIDNAGEMNGFLKPRARLFENPLTVENGAMIVPAGDPPRLDRAALDAATIERTP
jgi:L-Ala-D/L-Glu epimerase